MSADFWAGYISGAAGIIIGNPLDLIKTRLQAGDASVHATSPQSLRSTFDKAGTLVRGATAPILGYGALNALLFVTYNRTLTLFNPDPTISTSLTSIWASGAIGGLATFIVSAPTELIKVRTQVQGHGSSTSNSSSLTIAKEIWKANGLKGLYFGGAVTSIRDAVGYGFYFWSYEICKRSLKAEEGKEDSKRMAEAKVLLAGGLAGIVTWASIFPLDVIKTRVQTQSFSAAVVSSPVTSPSVSHPSPNPERQTLLTNNDLRKPDPVFRRKGAIEMARLTYQNEGVAVFFRGLGICSVRAFVVNAVQWAVYEWMMKVMQSDAGPNSNQNLVVKASAGPV
ncbi:mitochondrial carrier [Tothia fuscella]|uniref:Mitochondrial carrier n=1 Tax=Tothia fuscella TaxID=1048955 RepID=A0A9P4P0N2_9PEZI|nr:mitochondrial carrier [Tothia fuscella]